MTENKASSHELRRNLIEPAGPPNDPIELYCNAVGGCEWGTCGDTAVALRWDDNLYGDNGYAWLVVCEKHKTETPDKPIERRKRD